MGNNCSNPENSCELRCCCCCSKKSCRISCCWCCSPVPCPFLQCFFCSSPSGTAKEIQAKPEHSDGNSQTDPEIKPSISPVIEPPVRRSPPPPSPPPPISPDKPEPDPSPASCFSDRSFSSSDQSKLLEGYENERLVTLEEALAHLNPNPRVKDQIEVAKHECYYPSKDDSTMTKDQSAAIYIYSMRKHRENVYYLLRNDLKSSKRRKVKKWFKYLKLLFSAVELLPSNNIEIWQGTTFCPDQEDLFDGKSNLYTCIGSCSTSKDVVTMYHTDHVSLSEGMSIVLIEYKGVKAYDISDYIEGYHNEVFLVHGTPINKATMIKKKKGLWIAHLSYEPEQVHLELIGDVTPVSPTLTPLSSVRTATPVVSIPQPITPRFGHFTCPARGCNNRCDAHHTDSHCRGFSYLNHNCRHHCGSGYRCYKCHKHWSYFMMM